MESLMAINNVSSSSIYQTSQNNYQTTFKQNLQQLSDAVSSGNLSDASAALATIMKGLPNNSSTNSNNPMTADLQSLQTALKSGDLTSAQKAMATLQKDIKSVQGHHHHGHKGSGDQNSKASTAISVPSSLTSSQQDLLTGIGYLQSALSLGNTSDAQGILSSLQSNPSSVNPLSSSNSTDQNLQALQSALSSGDVNSAQNSFAAIMQSLQSSFDGSIGNLVDVKS